MRRHVVMLVAVGAVLGLSACALDPDDSQRAASPSTVPVAAVTPSVAVSASTVAASSETFPANGETTKIVALDNNFLPQALEVVAGTEVVFENNGRNDHDVVPVGDLQTVSWGVQAEAFAPKDTYSHVFGQPGTYAYYCTIHGTPTAGMVGSIVVTEP